MRHTLASADVRTFRCGTRGRPCTFHKHLSTCLPQDQTLVHTCPFHQRPACTISQSHSPDRSCIGHTLEQEAFHTSSRCDILGQLGTSRRGPSTSHQFRMLVRTSLFRSCRAYKISQSGSRRRFYTNHTSGLADPHKSSHPGTRSPFHMFDKVQNIFLLAQTLEHTCLVRSCPICKIDQSGSRWNFYKNHKTAHAASHTSSHLDTRGLLHMPDNDQSTFLQAQTLSHTYLVRPCSICRIDHSGSQ